MRLILPLLVAATALGAEPVRPAAPLPAAGVAAATPAPLTLEELCQILYGERARHPALVQKQDLNADWRPQPIEVTLLLVKRPGLLKQELPQVFARLDADGDGALSNDEIRAFVDRGHTWSPSRAEAPPAKPKNLGPHLAGGPRGAGTSLGGSGGGSAYAFFGQQQAYIADYNVVNDQLDPVIAVLGSGTLLEVSNVVVTFDQRRR